MLVQIDSRFVNTDHIVSIEGTATGHTATLVNGNSVSFPTGTIAPDDLCGTIVQAPAGMMLVEVFQPVGDEVDREVRFRTSVVRAFRITEGMTPPRPIGAFGEATVGFGYDYAVIEPDGRCFGSEDVWDNLDAFKAEQQSLADRQRHPPAPSHPGLKGTKALQPAAGTVAPGPEATPTGPETVEQLRAQIRAEPITGIHEESLWQAGREYAEVIDEVRAMHPDLHVKGVSYNPKWGRKWGPGDRDRARSEMTEPGNVEAFEAALQFLSHAGRLFPRKKVNDRRTSYSWKHVAERVMGVYVPNGMLVAAAYALGFEVVSNGSPNPWINLGDKAVLLDPQRGL